VAPGDRLLRFIAAAADHPKEFKNLSLPADFEISAAATVYPNAASVTSPGAAFNALRTAALANQADLAADAFTAPMTLPVAGFAIEGLNVSAPIPATVIIAVPIPAAIIITIPATTVVSITQFKVSAAAAIHPDSTPVITPGSSLNAL
jgi:hypothetical protein